MREWIVEQARQPSTFRGLLVLGASWLVGSHAEALVEASTALVLALVGLWDVLRRGRHWGEPGA